MPLSASNIRNGAEAVGKPLNGRDEKSLGACSILFWQSGRAQKEKAGHLALGMD